MGQAGSMADEDYDRRHDALHQGTRLEWFTVAWNVFEVVVTVTLGVLAGSLALVAYGLDSVIEIFASLVVVRYISRHESGGQAARALRLVALAFAQLAAYLVVASSWSLAHREVSASSPLGIAYLAIAASAMFVLALRKRRLASIARSAPLAAAAVEVGLEADEVVGRPARGLDQLGAPLRGHPAEQLAQSEDGGGGGHRGEGPTEVGVDQGEEADGELVEGPDAQLGVEQDDPGVEGALDVLEVEVAGLELGGPDPELVVERRELLVGGRDLLGGGLELLGCRLELLVECLHLLVRGGEVLDGFLQRLVCLEILSLRDHPSLGHRDACGRSSPVRARSDQGRIEADDGEDLIGAVEAPGGHLHGTVGRGHLSGVGVPLAMVEPKE